MFASLVCLCLAQTPAPLEIINPRPTYGTLGSARVLDHKERIPGDIAYFAFDLKNVHFDQEGSAHYSLTVEILDPKGELFYRNGPTNGVAQNLFGGNTLPVQAKLEVPSDAPPGTYTLRITAKDRTTGQSVTFSKEGKVGPPSFGLVRTTFSSDREARVPAPGSGVKGQPLYLNFAVVGFSRDAKKQPKVEVDLRVLNEKGEVISTKGLHGVIDTDIPDQITILPLQFGLTLNHPGQFTLELSARDVIAGTTNQLRIPLRVYE